VFRRAIAHIGNGRFSALQRAEIAEIRECRRRQQCSSRAEIAELGTSSFSALQRAEIAEIACTRQRSRSPLLSFSALQRAEIAEIEPFATSIATSARLSVSVLFNEPKLLKSLIACKLVRQKRAAMFQCSSTSRNC
jgi:hypothetical protein